MLTTLWFGLALFDLFSGLVDTFKEVVEKSCKILRPKTVRGYCQPFQKLVEWSHDDTHDPLDGVNLDDLLVHVLVECAVVVFFLSLMFFRLDAILLNQESKRVPGKYDFKMT